MMRRRKSRQGVSGATSWTFSSPAYLSLLVSANLVTLYYKTLIKKNN
jgi:hypothetical protein